MFKSDINDKFDKTVNQDPESSIVCNAQLLVVIM